MSDPVNDCGPSLKLKQYFSFPCRPRSTITIGSVRRFTKVASLNRSAAAGIRLSPLLGSRLGDCFAGTGGSALSAGRSGARGDSARVGERSAVRTFAQDPYPPLS